MIGLDTNVLVRFFIQDDAQQCSNVDAIMSALSAEDQGWIGVAVLMELAWVLSRTYRLERIQIADCFHCLLSSSEIAVEQTDAVRQAVEMYRTTNVSFADCLITASARGAGCSAILTFDVDAAKSAGMTLLS
jgi:predicted nucleic-acid-binding protein